MVPAMVWHRGKFFGVSDPIELEIKFFFHLQASDIVRTTPTCLPAYVRGNKFLASW